MPLGEARFVASRRSPGLRWARAAAALIVAATAASATTAARADPTPANRTLAQSLFEQARKLMAAKDFSAACPKLAQSEALDPSPGTLLNLAVCHEQSGRLATAWSEFNDAAASARAAREDARVSFATTRVRAIEPRLAHVTIVLHGPAEGVTATLDRAAVGNAAFSTPVPIDTGNHALAVAVDGKQVWETTLDVPSDGASVTVEVPSQVLVRAPTPTASPAPVATTTGPLEPPAPRWPAYVALGVGGAGLVAGTIFGVIALGAKGSLDDYAGCPSACPAAQRSRVDSLHTDELLADVGLGVGVVGAAVGAFLLLRSTSVSASTSVGIDVAPTGVRVRGSF
jgi:hypothetical protein